MLVYCCNKNSTLCYGLSLPEKELLKLRYSYINNRKKVYLKAKSMINNFWTHSAPIYVKRNPFPSFLSDMNELDGTLPRNSEEFIEKKGTLE